MLSTLLLLAASPQGYDTDQLYEELQLEERITPEVRIFQAVVPAVVFIETEFIQKTSAFGRLFHHGEGSGSGVVVHPDGYIVTNYHVVRKAQRIHVSFAHTPGKFRAELVSYKTSDDLALLRISEEQPDVPPEAFPAEGFPTVRLGTSSDLLEAERVVAIGNPYGQTHTVSKGIISGLHRNMRVESENLVFNDLIQTDASINYGNSGGPLLNIRGELIGINTAMNTQAENIGFAIPVDRVRDVLNEILYPEARRSWLGFELADDGSLRVGTVWRDGPAYEAGICEGDEVVSIAGQEVLDRDNFLHATLEIEPRQAVEVAFRREGPARATTIASWDRLEGLLFKRLGLRVREEIVGRVNVLFVDRVAAGSPAARMQLEPNDLMAAIRPGPRSRTYELRSRRQLAEFVNKVNIGAELDLEIFRDDNGDRRFTENERYVGSLVTR